MANETHSRVLLPNENDVRLQAWAGASLIEGFADPVQAAGSDKTIALALRTLAQEVLLLRARVEVLERAVLRQDVDADG
jgi:hypothetical protein